LEYAEQLGTLMTGGGDARAPRSASSRPRLWFRAGEARAVAILVRSQFRNDLRFRMGVFAIIPLTLIYLIMGVSDAREAGAATPDLSLVSVAILIFPTMLRSNLAASDAFRASWIYFATPADRARLIRSARDILAVFFLLPYLALAGVTLTLLVDDPLWLLEYLAMAGLSSFLMLFVATLLSPELPFDQPHEKMQETSRVIFVMILAGVVGILLMKLVDWLYGNPVALATAFAAVIAASVLVGRLTRTRIERQAEGLEFLGEGGRGGSPVFLRVLRGSMSRGARSRLTQRRGVFQLTQRRGERGEVAGPGCVRRGAERSSSGSTFMIVVVSSGGIHAHPAADAAGRGRLHPANPDPPGANHHIKR